MSLSSLVNRLRTFRESSSFRVRIEEELDASLGMQPHSPFVSHNKTSWLSTATYITVALSGLTGALEPPFAVPHAVDLASQTDNSPGLLPDDRSKL